MNEQEKFKKIALMCRDILESDEPFYWNYDLEPHEKDIAIDLLLRSVLGLAEKESEKRGDGIMDYVEAKFYGAYSTITKKKVYPK